MVQTIKTAVVVVLLLAVCYGAYVALNAPEPDLPPSIQEWAMGDDQLEELIGIDMGEEVSSMEASVPVDPAQLMKELSQGQLDASASAQESANSPGPASLGLPISIDSPGGAASSAVAPPAFPELPTNPDALSMPALTSNVDVSSFPALDASLPKSTTALVGSKQPVNPGEEFGSAGNLIPPMLETPNASQQQTQTYPVATSQSANPTGQAKLPTLVYSTARTEALAMAGRGELKEALEMLTPYFDSPELGYEERSDLVDILDALSKEVIYSNRHILEPAYVVGPQDSVASVAKAYKLNPEFLNAINGMGDSKALVPGSRIKVVQGPFRSVIDLSRGELTLFLGNLYAGRFPFSAGKEPEPRAGNFAIVDRRMDRTYYGASSIVISGEDPRNPYGGYWMHLGNDLCIHGTPVMASSDLENAGCISLAPIDAKDVFSILVIDSQVEIR